jgi:hypothetical protein
MELEGNYWRARSLGAFMAKKDDSGTLGRLKRRSVGVSG